MRVDASGICVHMKACEDIDESDVGSSENGCVCSGVMQAWMFTVSITTSSDCDLLTIQQKAAQVPVWMALATSG